VPDNPLGRILINRAREAGVAVDHVILAPGERAGVYFLEFGAAPRASGLLYDRKDSAAARMDAGLFDWPRILAGASWFHITGITPAISPTARAAATEAIRAAKEAGVRISLDPNYRSLLWSLEDAGRWLADVLPLVDVFITSPEQVGQLFGIPSDDLETAARQTAERFSLEVVAFTLRETPLVWRNRWTAVAFAKGRLYRTAEYEVEIVDRLGAGDAFAAGLIDGLIDGDVQVAIDRATAAGALKHSIPGDFPWLNRGELEALIAGGGLRIRR
jgi:2-dehydro-3-deoxygluconokinase